MRLSSLLCFLFCFPAFMHAASAGTLGAPIGNLPVGYRLEWVADETRSWAVPDASGDLHPGPRWVRVSIWYPATAGTGKEMAFGDYLNAAAPQVVPPEIYQAIHANDMTLKRIYGADESRFQRAMAEPSVAKSWADPRPGRYPVVVYSIGQNDWSQDAVLLAEYLASQGNIVVSVPHMGTNQRRDLLFVHEPYSYETQLRDLELGLEKALKMKSADPTRIAAAGHSYGGIYAMLLAMRNGAVKGVIGLDPTYVAQRAPYEYDLHKFPFFDQNLRIPIVTLRRAQGDIDRTIIDSLLRSPRLEIVYPELMHGDFATSPFLEKDLPESMLRPDELKYRSPQAAVAGAQLIFKQVDSSLRAIFASKDLRQTVLSDPNVKQEVSWKPTVNAPTEEEVYWIYKKKGLSAAESAVKDSESQYHAVKLFQENALITISKELGYAGKDDESLDMFRVTAAAFPKSATAQLALAAAFEGHGNKSEAAKWYKKTLELDPDNKAAKEALTKLAP